jgi:ribosomal protein S18 acetylase RimI-like enzyme
MSAPDFELRPLVPGDRKWVEAVITLEWEAAFVVAHGEVFRPADLPGFVALTNLELVGLVTYRIEAQECEIITLNSWREGIGVGSRLIEAVRQEAIEAGCQRLCLTTTNNNLHALAFYQKCGFILAGIRLNAMTETRKLKPQIPLFDEQGLPIRDELELEMFL